MKNNKRTEYNYHVLENGINEILFEKNNTAYLLREVAWGKKKKDELKEEPHSLELRKWYIQPKSEVPGKGIIFKEKELANNLTHSLVKLGYGNTKNIIDNIKFRNDFEESLAQSISKNKIEDAKNKEVIVDNDAIEFYDPKEII